MSKTKKRIEKERAEYKAKLIQACQRRYESKPIITIESKEDLSAFLRGDPVGCPDAANVKKDWRGRKITERQLEILNFITDYQRKNGFSPSVRDIAEARGITVKGAYDHITALVKKGCLMHTAGVSRSLQVVQG